MSWHFMNVTKKSQKKVRFADECDGRVAPFRSLCMYKLESQTTYCEIQSNEHTGEYKRTSLWHSRHEEACELVGRHGACLSWPCLPAEESYNSCLWSEGKESESAHSKALKEKNSAPSSNPGDFLCCIGLPRELAKLPLTTNVAALYENSEGTFQAVSNVYRMHRKVRTLWLTFTATPSQHDDEREVALASATFNTKASQLEGKVHVRNVVHDKKVFVRYTLDNWRSHRDVAATRQSSKSTHHCDLFSFAISVPVTHTHGSAIAFAVCLRIGDREVWDNNNSANYEGRVVYENALLVSGEGRKSGQEEREMHGQNEVLIGRHGSQ